MSGQPEIAVVIATHAREERLGRALDALARQTLVPDRFEVVVVRSAGTTPAAPVPEELTVRSLTAPAGAGAAEQRNLGWRSTEAPLVAFTDDDCRPQADWLARLADAADEGSVVQGRTEPDPDERELMYGLARTIELGGPSDRYETCNIAYPRSLLERLGGFDESIGAAWTEDTDLGLRAVDAGAELRFAGDALVWHAVVPRTLSQALRETGRYRWLVRLLARHPEYRRRQFPFRIVKTSHATLLVAVGGLLAGRRHPILGIAATSPYLAAHLRTHLETNPVSALSLARFAAHAPKATAVELAEVAVVLRAAIRHRTLVI